jgi:hypothetical protein
MNGVTRLGKRAGAVMGVSALFSLTLWPTAAHASSSIFTAQSEAYPFRSATYNESLPLGIAYEGYGPYAAAKFNSLGSSDATAAGPYPGETSAGGTGLAASVTGVDVPEYPFLLVTAAGDDPKRLSYPLTSLSAESGSGAAEGHATMGSDFSGASATARAERLSTGDVQSYAESTFDVLNLGHNASIRGLRTVARAVADSSGKVTRTSDLTFDSITAPGLAYRTPCEVPPQIPMPTKTPLPCGQSYTPTLAFANGQFMAVAPDGKTQSAPLGAAAATTALKNAGINFAYQAAESTPQGIIGSGIVVSYDFPALPPNQSGVQGVTNQTYAIGFSSASATQAAESTSGVAGGGVAPAALGALTLLTAGQLVRRRSDRNGEF